MEVGIELPREVRGEGPEDARIVLLAESPSYEEFTAKRPFQNFASKMLLQQFLQAGILRSQMRLEYVCEQVVPNRHFTTLPPATQIAWKADALQRVKALKPNVIVPLGDIALSVVTPHTSSDKYHLSIIPSLVGPKCIPLLWPERILRNFKEIFFLTFGATRIAEESKFPEIINTQRQFTIRPTLLESLATLKKLEHSEWLSVDIETCAGQITCIGFAATPTAAISIPTLQRDYSSPEEFFELWTAIAKVLAAPSKKVGQNFNYDMTYLAKYGIRVRNFFHDTMIANKFLHPESTMGLDTVARLYTKEPYWKDEAKNWSARQNAEDLYYYNCKDAAVTLEAAFAQRLELERRGHTELFKKRCMDLTSAVSEMCWRGLPVNETERLRLRTETEKTVEELQKQLDVATTPLMGGPINPRSPTQIKNLLKVAGMKIPMKMGKESSDRESLMRLRLKHPESPILTPLVQLSAEQKKLSSYLNFAYDPDGCMRYSLMLLGTETNRMACYTDPWDRGINAQTIPSGLKSMFEMPDADELFVEVDLRQADARVVAWDGPEPTLMKMFQDGADIHRYVASQPELFNCTSAQVTKQQRQLGKKTGHAANYGMKGPTLSTQCLKEMDLVVPPHKAEQMLAGYHRTFPGIRRWQKRIQEEVLRQRYLTTPMGRMRQFYERPGDDLFKEAYAYRPQSTVADVINCLILHMRGHAKLLLQVHDSALLRVRSAHLKGVLARICDQDAWNPRLKLPGGELRIPIEIKVGRNWSKMEEVFSG